MLHMLLPPCPRGFRSTCVRARARPSVAVALRPDSAATDERLLWWLFFTILPLWFKFLLLLFRPLLLLLKSAVAEAVGGRPVRVSPPLRFVIYFHLRSTPHIIPTSISSLPCPPGHTHPFCPV